MTTLLLLLLFLVLYFSLSISDCPFYWLVFRCTGVISAALRNADRKG